MFLITGSRKSQEKSLGNKVLFAKRSPVSDDGRGLKRVRIESDIQRLRVRPSVMTGVD